MNIKAAIFIVLCSFNSVTLSMPHHHPKHTKIEIDSRDECKKDIERQDSDESNDDNNQKKCCNSSNKLKIALVGLATTTVTAIVALVIHFTKC